MNPITDLAVKNPFSSPFLSENTMPLKQNQRKFAFAAAAGGKSFLLKIVRKQVSNV